MEEGVASLEMRPATSIRALSAHSITLISPFTPGRESSGWATRSKEGLSGMRGLALRDSMRAESDGVYEEMYRSEKYRLQVSFGGIGPIA